jgi:hypothetical protein
MLMVLMQRPAFVSGNRSEGYGHPVDRGACRSMGRKLRSEDAEEANFGFFCEEVLGPDPALNCARLPDRMWWAKDDR